jgi:hypothetical protein
MLSSIMSRVGARTLAVASGLMLSSPSIQASHAHPGTMGDLRCWASPVALVPGSVASPGDCGIVARGGLSPACALVDARGVVMRELTAAERLVVARVLQPQDPATPPASDTIVGHYALALKVEAHSGDLCAENVILPGWHHPWTTQGGDASISVAHVNAAVAMQPSQYYLQVPGSYLTKGLRVDVDVRYSVDGRWVRVGTATPSASTCTPGDRGDFVQYTGAMITTKPVFSIRFGLTKRGKRVRVLSLHVDGGVLTPAHAVRTKNAQMAADLGQPVLAELIRRNTRASLAQANILVGVVPALTAETWALAGEHATVAWPLDIALQAAVDGKLTLADLEKYSGAAHAVSVAKAFAAATTPGSADTAVLRVLCGAGLLGESQKAVVVAAARALGCDV